jgi:hypothetical protein
MADPAPTPVWLTTAEAATHANRARQLLSGGAAHITAATIRQWARRGHLTAGGLDPRGRPLYTLTAVAAAEQATRTRALRLAGIAA